jgi:hypothetical protein
MVKIVNLRDKTVKYDHYIGRANKWRGLPGSKWANPFPMVNEEDRRRVLDAYRAHILNTPALYDALEELDGLTLACWCAPKKCHGDILIELLEKKRLDKANTSVTL